MKKSLPIVISAFLIIVALLAGIWMLATGLRDTAAQNRLKAEYQAVEGHLSDYTLQSEGGYDFVRRKHSGPTYYLTYTYFVDDVPYTVTTDYSTGSVPELGSPRTIYYDPADPGRAIPGGVSGSGVMMVAGVMFTAVPLVFILGFCQMMGWLPRTRIEIMDLVMGGVTAAIGGGFLLLMEGPFHLMMLIPWLLVAAGVWLVIRGIFFSGKSKKKDVKPCRK